MPIATQRDFNFINNNSRDFSFTNSNKDISTLQAPPRYFSSTSNIVKIENFY
jgi:hypothetical protein